MMTGFLPRTMQGELSNIEGVREAQVRLSEAGVK